MLSATDTIKAAAKAIVASINGFALVEDQCCSRVVTTSDILLNEYQRIHPREKTLDECLPSHIVGLSKESITSNLDIIECMSDNRISTLPVFGENGIDSIISVYDVVKDVVLSSQKPSAPLKCVTSANRFVSHHVNCYQVIQRMVDSNSDFLVVVDGANRIIKGVVTAEEIIQNITLQERDAEEVMVSAVMTPWKKCCFVPSSCSSMDALLLMLHQHKNYVIFVDLDKETVVHAFSLLELALSLFGSKSTTSSFNWRIMILSWLLMVAAVVVGGIGCGILVFLCCGAMFFRNPSLLDSDNDQRCGLKLDHWEVPAQAHMEETVNNECKFISIIKPSRLCSDVENHASYLLAMARWTMNNHVSTKRDCLSNSDKQEIISEIINAVSIYEEILDCLSDQRTPLALNLMVTACFEQGCIQMDYLGDEKAAAILLTKALQLETQLRCDHVDAISYQLLCYSLEQLKYRLCSCSLALGKYEVVGANIGSLKSSFFKEDIIQKLSNIQTEAWEAGNDVFKKGNFSAAIAQYNLAIRLDNVLAKGDAGWSITQYSALFLNRAACYYRLHDLQRTVDDAEYVIGLNPKCAKAWKRLYLACKEGKDDHRAKNLLKEMENLFPELQPWVISERIATTITA